MFFLKIKYHELYNENGECYFLDPNGFQHTRYWMNQFHGKQLAEAMFHFCQCLRELHLNESELSLVLPLHVCYFGKRSSCYNSLDWDFWSLDSTMEDQDIIRMLRSCYLHALYSELRHNRDENEAKIMCSRILQVCLEFYFLDWQISYFIDTETSDSNDWTLSKRSRFTYIRR